MDYLWWNDRIASKFFNPANEYRRVYLYVTRELLADLAGDCSAPLPDFIAAVKRGPEWVSPGRVCSKAFQTFAYWRQRRLPFPPYIGYLGLFALAAGIEGDFAAHAYYPRLRRVLGETPNAGTYPGFSRMRALWEDVEVWSQEDQKGRLGVFGAETSSHLVHVGLPISQTILSETERNALPGFFADQGVDASTPLSDLEPRQLLTDHADSFRPRTRRILADRNMRAEEFAALLEAVAQELVDWDGTVPESQPESSTSSPLGRAVLWCEDIDPVAETIDVRLLCRTRHEFPEEGLTFEIAGRVGQFKCEEALNGWSTCIRSNEGWAIDAALLDWTAGVRLREIFRNWNFSLTASSVRLFVSAAFDGFSGFIETQTLLPNTPFLLFTRHEHQQLIERWGDDGCAAFERIHVRAGMPAGWLVYSAEGANTDNPVATHFSVLSFPRTARILLKGGISSSPGTYFPFALPNILVTGVTQPAELVCNDEVVGICNGTLLTLPTNLTGISRLQLEVKVAGRVACRRAIYSESPVSWPERIPDAWCDPFGDFLERHNLPRAVGAIVESDLTTEFRDWVGSESSGSSISIDRKDTSDEQDAPVAATTEASNDPRVVVPSEEDIREVLNSWREEVAGQLGDRGGQSLSARPMGRSLTEGCIQYLTACSPAGTQRNFARAISELSRALSSPDPLVATIAFGLLQLAYHRSDRQEEAAALLNTVQLPQGFGRLQSFMAVIAGNRSGELSLTGIGIADISPVGDDADLELRIFNSAAPRVQER